MLDWIIVLVVALINFVGVFVSTKRAKKSEYINSVSASRREWLEKVRNNFIEYNQLIQNPYIEFEDSHTQRSKFSLNHIEMNLLLNPSERYTYFLSILYSAMKIRKEGMSEKEIENAINESTFVSTKEFSILKKLLSQEEMDQQKLYDFIQLLQQIILKREWEIIKQEVKSGKTINAKTQNKITTKVVDTADEDEKINKLLNSIGA